MTGGWLDVVSKVFGLLSPFILAFLAWAFKRRIDNAQAAASLATAAATDATAEKTRVETSGLVVSNAVSAAEKLVALYQASQEREARILAMEQAAKDKEAAEFRASASTKIQHLEKQVAGLQRVQHQIATSLLPHAIWDGRIWAEVRESVDPEYPPPPSFGLDGLPNPGDYDDDEEDCPTTT